MQSARWGYLEFSLGSHKPCRKYPLEPGRLLVGTDFSCTIRIRSKKLLESPVVCELDVSDTGLATLTSKSNTKFHQQFILYNGQRLRNCQILKNNDTFSIAGKDFTYVNATQTTLRVDKTVAKDKRQSLKPGFKVTSSSKIPVPYRSVTTRKSLSASKPKKLTPQRSCFTAVQKNKHKPDDWDSTQSPSQSRRTSKPENLGIQVRKSLFLKNKVNVKASTSLHPTQQLSFKVEKVEVTRTPSLRGFKRGCEGSISCERTVKRRRPNDLSINVSISSTSPFDSKSSSDGSLDSTYPMIDIPTPDTSKSYFAEFLNISVENISQTSKRQRKLNKSELSNASAGSLFDDSREVFDTPNAHKRGEVTSDWKPPSVSSTPKTRNTLINTSDLSDVFKTPRVTTASTTKKSRDSIERVSGVSTSESVFDCSLSLRRRSRISSMKQNKRTSKVIKNARTPNSSQALSDVGAMFNTPEPLFNASASSDGLRKTPKASKSLTAMKENKTRKFQDVETPKAEVKNARTPKITSFAALSDISGVGGILNSSPNFNSPGRHSKTPKTLTATKENKRISKSPRKFHDSKTPKALSKVKNPITPKINSSQALLDVSGVGAMLNTPEPVFYSSPITGSSCKRSETFPFMEKNKRTSRKSQMFHFNPEGAEVDSKAPKLQKESSNELFDGDEKFVTDSKRANSIRNSSPELQNNLSGVDASSSTPAHVFNLSTNVNSPARTPRVRKIPSKYMASDVESIFKTPKSPFRLLQNAEEQSLGVQKPQLSVNKKVKTPKSGKEKKLLKILKQKSPKNDLRDVKGVGRLMKTPRIQKSPLNDLTNVKGVKSLLGTPKNYKSPKNDLTKIKGLVKIFGTRKEQKSPRNDLTDIRGVKKLMATPKIQGSPKNDLTQIKGLKKMFATPKQQKSPMNDLTNIRGVKKLMATPKIQGSPKNDLTQVKGLKKMFATPKQQQTPKNDLTNIRGVKKLMASPKLRASPKKDLTQIKGVQKMFATPKEQKAPKNDLANICNFKNLLQTPKSPTSPKYDLTQVQDIKNIIATPKPQKLAKSPKNDLSNVVGLKALLKTPRPQKEPMNDLSNVSGISELFGNSFAEEPSRRGRRKQPAQEAEMPQKRSMRKRDKKSDVQNNLKSEESANMRIETRKIEESSDTQRKTRGKKRNDVVVEELPTKRIARGRGKNKGENIDGSVSDKETFVETTTRGRKKITGTEDSEEQPIKTRARSTRKKPAESVEPVKSVSRRGKKKEEVVIISDSVEVNNVEELLNDKVSKKRTATDRRQKKVEDEKHNDESADKELKVPRRGRTRAQAVTTENVAEDANPSAKRAPGRSTKKVVCVVESSPPQTRRYNTRVANRK